MDNKPTNSPVRVLAVEDNPEFTDMLDAILCDLHAGQFHLRVAGSLQEGLEKLALEAPDVILLDLTLPDSAGLDTFHQVYALHPEIPIVVFTAIRDKETALAAVRQGAQDYLVKGELEVNFLVRSLFYAIERHRTRLELRQLSLHDELTGLLNRRGFMTMSQQLIQMAARNQWQLALVFADLDSLKMINDYFGHPEGDKALKQIAQAMRDTFRSSDVLARMGGDEFIALARINSEADIDQILGRVQENIDAHNHENPNYDLSLSYGIARFDPLSTITVEEMISEADIALYRHKQRKGRR